MALTVVLLTDTRSVNVSVSVSGELANRNAPVYSIRGLNVRCPSGLSRVHCLVTLVVDFEDIQVPFCEETAKSEIVRRLPLHSAKLFLTDYLAIELDAKQKARSRVFASLDFGQVE